ncbi:MAG: hypothetical protein JSW25_02995, partial [Thermoplasmata archaeon]
ELTVKANSSYGWVEDHTFRYIYPDGVLNEQVLLILSDGQYEVDQVIEIYVTPVNDAPELTTPDDYPLECLSGAPFDFIVVFKDIDSETPVVQVVVDGHAYRCEAELVGNTSYKEGVPFHIHLQMDPGDHTASFVAYDGDGGEAKTDEFTVTVNKPPESYEDSGLKTYEILLIILVLTIAILSILLIRMRLG